MSNVKKENYPRGNTLRYKLIQRLMQERLLHVKPDGTVTYKGNPVKPKLINSGYHRVKFYLGNYVDFDELHHRFMYMALVGQIPENWTIDHIDKDRTNNHISNLRLMTLEDNSSSPGEKNPAAKLRKEDIETIKWMYNVLKISQTDIASTYGVHQANISGIIRGKIWREEGSQPMVEYPAAKLQEGDAQIIKDLYATGKFSQKKIGVMFAVTQAHISRIISGK